MFRAAWARPRKAAGAKIGCGEFDRIDRHFLPSLASRIRAIGGGTLNSW